MSDLQTIFDQLQPLKASELRSVIAEAKRLLARKPLYIREISKPTPHGRYIYLYATWNEGGKTQQKSLGRKREHVAEQERDEEEGYIDREKEPRGQQGYIDSEFARYGVYASESVAFLRSMLAQGFYLAN